jgi:hypothetical protein
MREKRVINNTNYVKSWNSEPLMADLKNFGERLNDEKTKKAKEIFQKPSYFQSDLGRKSGGMKGHLDQK